MPERNLGIIYTETEWHLIKERQELKHYKIIYFFEELLKWIRGLLS